MDIRAAVFREVGAALRVERIVLDPPQPTEVLVRLAAIGLCRTDYHVMRGERRVAMQPMVLGHEAAGIVEAIGDQVQGVAPGDHVVLTFIPGCGHCRWCQRGLHHLCAEGPRITHGPQLDGSFRRRDAGGRDVGAFCMIGAFAEATVVDQASVLVIDKDIPLDHASLIACGVPAGVGAARHRARVKPGDTVLVVGCGGDGMNVVQGAKLCGASMIIAADIVAQKLEWARDFGATHGTTAQGDELISTVLALTDGIGVDHAFVCINPAETLLPAFRASTKAGNVVVTAITPDTVKQIDVPPLELFATQKAIMGAVYGFASPRLQIPELLGLYRRGDLKLGELISRTYRLDEINQGYADLDAGRNLRGVVLID
ncbi:Alcohol dehydrogenase GroES domain protein [Rhodopseudomonas palustris TIE-1]|uniref:Zn-dependent alcohol dehydrogenase n=1 Tax=Rhodopseudomonas palustris TaxID=1076 RepID=UPI000164AB27|nr:Zn-dependent alcohol dehydrogenase [Rhodopseudomonas palustris]ACE99300.1 Alcohol dehydrogenase GroES domain protein [Rhodopseudomonas palustris TIE-1]